MACPVPPRRAGGRSQITIRTDLVDCQMYVFNREAVLGVLAAKPSISSVKQVRVRQHRCP
jgi:hypothetical protein